MIILDTLLKSPCFVKSTDDTEAPLPARIHALFPGGQPFLFDQSDNITLHPSPTDWIICDADNPSNVSLISYVSFFDHYQPENAIGWDYLGQFFADQHIAPSAPESASEDTFHEEPAALEPTETAESAPESDFHADQYEMRERLMCECGSHELSVYANGYMDGDIEIAFWKYGLGPYKRTLRARLRQIWDILTKGHAYADMVILNRAEQAKLVQIIEQSHDLSERYEAARATWLASRPKPQRDTFTLQEVADMQAHHEAEKQELLDIIETLSVKLQPQS